MKKALVIGVATISLIAFSGLAVCDVWYTHYVEYNSKGWEDYGMIGNYHVLGRYNYREKQVYSVDHGWAYLSYHYIHSNWDLKYLDGNKPITITHYNCIYRYKAEVVDSSGTLKWSEKAIGYYRIIDPQASNLKPPWPRLPEFFMQDTLTPFITKYMDHSEDPPYGPPAIEDAVKLTEMIFNNIDFALLPLIKYIEIRDLNGNSIQIDCEIL